MNKVYLFILCITLMSLFAQNKNNEWEIALPGKIVSTPIERRNNELLLICEDRRLYSIDSTDGSINWKIKPGGKLDQLLVSHDSSIILRDSTRLFSIYGDGSIRWSLEFVNGFKGNISINDKGYIYFTYQKALYRVDRFGNSLILKDNFDPINIFSLENSLILYESNKKMIAVTESGNFAWEFIIENEPLFTYVINKNIYLAYSSGLIENYSYDGALIRTIETNNINPINCYENYKGDLLLVGDKGTTLINSEGFNTDSIDNEIGLYYSNGLIIDTNSDWIVTGRKSDSNNEYYQSGKKQLIKSNISLSDKKVWNDDELSEYYRNIILHGTREQQINILKDIELEINSIFILDEIPNFYEILLLASSDSNKFQDMRLEAYRIIGLSRDISFFPYLLEDLEYVRSYLVIQYIYYALGQLSIDRSGSAIELIASRIDDYFDEKLVINGLYAMYNINKYTNGEFVGSVFKGVEKILNGGYSRNINNMCYEIIGKLK